MVRLRFVSIVRSFTSHLRKNIGAGVLLLVPVVITYIALRFVFSSVDDVLARGINKGLGRSIPGLGVIGLIALLYLAGVIGRSVVGRRIVTIMQRALLNIPLVKIVYSSARQFIESFSGSGSVGFKRVVMIEYSRPRTWAIGFLTGVTQSEDDEALTIVYIPTAPTLNSG